MDGYGSIEEEKLCICASDSRPLDNNNRPLLHHHQYHSQWLHSTLAEMDRKTKMILDLVEDNRDRFGETAEMYYNKRPQLIQSVSDLQSSYHALADEYHFFLLNQTISHSLTTSSSSPPNSLITFKLEEEGVQLMMNNAVNMRLKMWDEMRISVWKLMEDNLRQQEELIKRNDEKREYIRRLGLLLDQLQKENARLKQSLLLRTHNKSTIHDDDVEEENKKKKKKQCLQLAHWISRLKAWFIFDKNNVLEK